MSGLHFGATLYADRVQVGCPDLQMPVCTGRLRRASLA